MNGFGIMPWSMTLSFVHCYWSPQQTTPSGMVISKLDHSPSTNRSLYTLRFRNNLTNSWVNVKYPTNRFNWPSVTITKLPKTKKHLKIQHRVFSCFHSFLFKPNWYFSCDILSCGHAPCGNVVFVSTKCLPGYDAFEQYLWIKQTGRSPKNWMMQVILASFLFLFDKIWEKKCFGWL